MKEVMELSTQARSLWAKLSNDSEDEWLPLVVHMHDAAIVAEHIWDTWLSHSVKEVLKKEMAQSGETVTP